MQDESVLAGLRELGLVVLQIQLHSMEAQPQRDRWQLHPMRALDRLLAPLALLRLRLRLLRTMASRLALLWLHLRLLVLSQRDRQQMRSLLV
ncbi:hypothetical protein, partial [Corallococcus praedator]|uniref:hypothetical protein n=1 Tax=Corallococcus praedator TaxID=2316724 RepID=UPI001ABFB6DE